MNKRDEEIWRNISASVKLQDLIGFFQNPSPFQKELSNLIELIFTNYTNSSNPNSIEVGSAFGITSALLPDKFTKAILDFDSEALDKAKTFFEVMEQPVKIFHMDFFDLNNKLSDRFDLVFNAGVLEHFNKAERRTIIKNMASITRDKGYIIVGIPNHSSLPYRISYLLRILFNKWPYPKEYSIKRLEKEISDFNNLDFVGIKCFDKESIFFYLPKLLKKFFITMDGFLFFESYLKVYIFQKNDRV